MSNLVGRLCKKYAQADTQLHRDSVLRKLLPRKYSQAQARPNIIYFMSMLRPELRVLMLLAYICAIASFLSALRYDLVKPNSVLITSPPIGISAAGKQCSSYEYQKHNKRTLEAS